MIWINISNILHESKFSGIARTEYEFCTYAQQLKNQGYLINFCTFDDTTMSFNTITETELQSVIIALKNGTKQPIPRPTLFPRLFRSFKKRIAEIKLLLGLITHKFQNNDTIIGVGQRLGDVEMRAFLVIKKNIKIQLKVLCHDILPVTAPQFFTKHHINTFHQYIQKTVIAVDFFYCNSEFTKNELTNYYHKNNLIPPPMQVVTLGCDLQDKTKNITNDNSVNELIQEPYLLFVSTIEIRKNHQLIYDIYLKLLEQGITNLPKVYFVGRHGWNVDELLHQLDNDERIKGKIILLHNVTNNQLLQLYKNCWFTLYPSFIEGYGLPVAESLSMGKYCLSSNAGSLPEAGGEFIDYLSPYELDSWCEKFVFLINHPDYITQKEQYIKDNYHPISWENFTKEILENEL